MRSDLSAPQQVVQACHAAIEVAKSFLPTGSLHPHIVVCAVADERQLFQCIDRFRRLEIAYRAFYEPDRGNELTAIGTEPVSGERRQVFKRYRCLSQAGFTWAENQNTQAAPWEHLHCEGEQGDSAP